MTVRRRPAERNNRSLEGIGVSWWTISKRVMRQMSEDNLSALAAGGAFYALLTVFPTLTAVVSIYGLVADPTMVERQLAAMEGILPPDAIKLVATWLRDLIQGSTAGFRLGLLISVLLSSWSLWSATGMLMTAVNICYGYEEDRSFVRFNIEALMLGAALGSFGAVALGLVALFPVLVDLLPLSAPWHAMISLVRWPILAALAIAALAVVYRYAPARIPQEWSWFSWGAATATALWLIGSVVFNFYVSKFGSYEKTYGSLGAVVVLLLWFYMSTYVILIGAELNAEIERYHAQRK